MRVNKMSSVLTEEYYLGTETSHLHLEVTYSEEGLLVVAKLERLSGGRGAMAITFSGEDDVRGAIELLRVALKESELNER